jgi:hypothetical protein
VVRLGGVGAVLCAYLADTPLPRPSGTSPVSLKPKRPLTSRLDGEEGVSMAAMHAFRVSGFWIRAAGN